MGQKGHFKELQAIAVSLEPLATLGQGTLPGGISNTAHVQQFSLILVFHEVTAGISCSPCLLLVLSLVYDLATFKSREIYID